MKKRGRGKWVKVPGKNGTHPDRIIATERQLEALELRKRGLKYHEIAPILGVSRQAAWDLVQKGMVNWRRVISEEAEDIRNLELDRLDSLIAAHLPKAEGVGCEPCEKSAGVVIKCMERRSKLLGLDIPAPSRVEVTGKDGQPIEHKLSLAEIVMRAYDDEQKQLKGAGDDDPEVLDA